MQKASYSQQNDAIDSTEKIMRGRFTRENYINVARWANIAFQNSLR